MGETLNREVLKTEATEREYNSEKVNHVTRKTPHRFCGLSRWSRQTETETEQAGYPEHVLYDKEYRVFTLYIRIYIRATCPISGLYLHIPCAVQFRGYTMQYSKRDVRASSVQSCATVTASKLLSLNNTDIISTSDTFVSSWPSYRLM